jgi:hypothetical protein
MSWKPYSGRENAGVVASGDADEDGSVVGADDPSAGGGETLGTTLGLGEGVDAQLARTRMLRTADAPRARGVTV